MYYEDHESRYAFDFMEAYIGDHTIDGSTIKVSVQKFVVLGGHPGFPKTTYVKSCTLVYEDVVRSERSVSEYATREGHGFKSSYTVLEENFPATDKELFSHAIEGISKKPFAYICWEIIAAAVRIEDVILAEDQPW